MPDKKDYPKKIISFDKQIALLRERAMLIEDVDFAKKQPRFSNCKRGCFFNLKIGMGYHGDF